MDLINLKDMPLILFLKRLSAFKLLALALIVCLAINTVFSGIAILLGYNLTENAKIFESLEEDLLLSVIIAPVLETFFLQTCLVGLLVMIGREYLNVNYVLPSVILASIIFGSLHYYNVGYIVVATVLGFLFNSFYILIKEKKKNAFWFTSAFHSLWNLIVTLGQHYERNNLSFDFSF